MTALNQALDQEKLLYDNYSQSDSAKAPSRSSTSSGRKISTILPSKNTNNIKKAVAAVLLIIAAFALIVPSGGASLILLVPGLILGGVAATKIRDEHLLSTRGDAQKLINILKSGQRDPSHKEFKAGLRAYVTKKISDSDGKILRYMMGTSQDLSRISKDIHLGKEEIQNLHKAAFGDGSHGVNWNGSSLVHQKVESEAPGEP